MSLTVCWLSHNLDLTQSEHSPTLPNYFFPLPPIKAHFLPTCLTFKANNVVTADVLILVKHNASTF